MRDKVGMFYVMRITRTEDIKRLPMQDGMSIIRRAMSHACMSGLLSKTQALT